jgi:hypothetical protein
MPKEMNVKLFLYIFLLPLLLVEWLITVAFNLVEVIADAIRDLTLSLKRFIHAEAKPANAKQPTKGL